jgi:periplasmic divalent cation tolerance protein
MNPTTTEPSSRPEVEACVALVSAPRGDAARALARALVDERRAACVSVVSGVQSVYRWRDAVHEEAEDLLVIKSTRDALAGLRDRVAELHEYDVPEFLVLPVTYGLPAYLHWLGEAVVNRDDA